MLLTIDEDGIPVDKVDNHNTSDSSNARSDEAMMMMEGGGSDSDAHPTSDGVSFAEAANETYTFNQNNPFYDDTLRIVVGDDGSTGGGGNTSTSGSTASFPSRGTILPWGAHKERPVLPLVAAVDTDLRPGEFVMRTLFVEFTRQAERKTDLVMSEPLDKQIAKLLQRGEDPQLDQILCAFGTVAEYCLPSLLRALFGWLERQMQHTQFTSDQAKRPQQDQKNKSIIYIVSGGGVPGVEALERNCEELQLERRDLAVEFLFCLALIEILKQLPFHPGHEDLVQYIENLAFKRFNYKEGLQSSNATNIHMIADLYAEVIGVLAQSRFMSVRKRFTAELKELKSKEPSPHTTQSIISLLMGMKFFRVKMVPIEEFEASFQFLQECAQYFLEVKDKDIKHALAGLFVEILVPVAASVKNEVNVPCLKNFVEMLYSQTLDASTKSKHRMALFPLVTCLLCVSQKSFFLNNWYYFLVSCLSHLKNRDPKMCRVALESLYRLLWVYMIRIKCESNSATQSRLQSIVNSLFPKGSKGVVPRDTPLNIFVKIIQFIAQERLDFAMREIVFELLMVGRPIKMILTPERMSIGLRAFLVVADSLQQKEGEPPMPRTTGTMPSGNTLRIKKTFLNKVLTDETARSIGMSAYFPYVRRILVDILRALDSQYGRPLSMTNTQNITKEMEINTGDRKPRIDLFRTCVAAIPRLIPDGMSGVELVEMLSRLTVHMDEELRGLAYQSLQTLVVDFPDWRQEVLAGFTHFLARDVQDTSPQLVDNGLRMLLQLVTSWRNNVTPGTSVVKQETTFCVIKGVEALALVMLCQCRLYSRRIAVHILREAKLLLEKLEAHDELPVIDVMDASCAAVAEKCLSLLPPVEKQALLSVSQPDLLWFCERSHPIWTPGIQFDANNGKSVPNMNVNPMGVDPWSTFLIGFMERDRVPLKCPATVHHMWPVLHMRINALYVVIDPIPVNDNRASLLRSATAPRKPANERDGYMHVWKNYLTMAFRVVPPIPSPMVRCGSPDISLSMETAESWLESLTSNKLFNGYSLSASLENLYSQGGSHGRFTIPLTYGRKDKQHKRVSSSPDSLSGERSDSKSPGGGASPCILYKLVVPLLKCELSDVRDVAVHAIGHINSDALKDLMDELVGLIREAVDRKQENMRRRRRRDALRLHLGRVLQLISENGTFANSSSVLENGSLHSTYVEYLDGARLCLELETEKDSPSVQEVKLIFCNIVTKIIKSFPLETYPTLLKKDLRRNLFQLFTGWAGSYSKFLVPFSTASSAVETDEDLQFGALQAMSAIACCGPCFEFGALSEEGYFYPWLHELLSSTNEKIYQLARETVVLLLDMNHDIGILLDWVIDKCYTGEPRIADGAFLALAMIFSTREYPCDHYTAVINVTLMCTGCPRAHVYEAALQLLQLLDKRFFGNVNPLPSDGDSSVIQKNEGTLDVLLSRTYCRSQLYLSEQLSQLHPELTMPMFSEITNRFQTARPEVRQLLPQYLLPWLVNIELVDPNVPPTNPLSYFQYEPKHPSTRREGMGSAEATEMVLNNLFYITAKVSDCHPKEIEELWSKLCSSWPNNLKVIMRYLIIISGMAPNELLVYAKRVVLYLARALPERLLDEMLTELQTVETLNCLIERTETPPFYRLTSMRKASSSHSDGPTANGAPDNVGRCDLTIEKGTIHTKRHSGEDPAKSTANKNEKLVNRSGEPYIPMDKMPRVQVPSPQLRTTEEMSSPNNEQDNSQTEELFSNQRQSSNTHLMIGSDDRFDVPQPHPLPMPEYGGYFAPLKEYLPDNSQPISGFHRCNVAVMLLCDVVLDGVQIDWSIHVPLMLHIVFLGLDHTRALVHDHCRQLLLNLLITVAAHNDHLTIARVMLNSTTARLGLGLPIPQLSVLSHNFAEPDSTFDNNVQGNISMPANAHVHFDNDNIEQQQQQQQQPITNPPVIVTGESETAETQKEDNEKLFNSTENLAEQLKTLPANAVNFPGPALPQPGSNMSTPDIIKSLIQFLANRPPNTPLWNYEDITAKVWSVRSCCQLNTLLQHVLKVFRESLPLAHISERWAQIALQLGLSCSSRHYAGRSLQVFRFIGVAMTGRMVSDILSRLVETVAEQGEDMQGYVTELLLTLEAAVDSLESNFRPLDFMKEIFKSTPNLNNKDTPTHVNPVGGKCSPGGCGGCMTNHTRSTSYSVSYCMRKNTSSSTTNETKERTKGCSEMAKMNTNLCRSRSAQSLKMLGDSATQDDKLTILATLFWLAVSLLESDYEHEFLLGVRLLGRVMHRLPLDRPDARDRVDRLQSQLRWQNFPGVHALLLKGCTHPATYESVVGLLTELTPLLELSVIDPTQSLAFPMNVIALLPYMLLHYEDANETCICAALHIAKVSSEKSKKLENLGTVMTLYSRRTFSKESFQWTKCVVKYLWDTYSHLSMQMLAFLVEILDKGSSCLHLPVLSVLHCMLHYIDLNTNSPQPINTDLLRVISKFIDGGAICKEAMKILKLVVTRCSTLVVPPHWDTNTSSMLDPELQTKKELPGRTMDFTFDLSQTPVIGRRFLPKNSTGPNSLNTALLNMTPEKGGGGSNAGSGPSSVTSTINPDDSLGIAQSAIDKLEKDMFQQENASESPKRSMSLSPADAAHISGWKRPWNSQARVRECLVNLLTTCGQRVGLPKSPSVIFSQSSELLERESSMASSLEEVSGAHGDYSGGSRSHDAPPDHFAVFKDFDFLEYESESIEGESSDNFNWGVRRHPLSGEVEVDIANASHQMHSSVVNVVGMNRVELPPSNMPVDLSPELVMPTSTDHLMDLSLQKALKSEIHPLEESSDDEVESESPIFESYIHDGSHQERRRTHSISSGSSGGDLTPCNAVSPGLVARPLSFRNAHEESWRSSILTLLRCTPHTQPLLLVHRSNIMLKEVINKTILLCLEGSGYLSTGVRNAFSTVTDLLNAEELPLIWTGNNLNDCPKLLDTVRFAALEMDEHLETFFDRKDHVHDSVESARGSVVCDEVGRSLYKLIFQLHLLLETNIKLVTAIYQSAMANNAVDNSAAIMTIGNALNSCIHGTEGCWGSEGSNTPTPSTCPSPCPSPSPHQPANSGSVCDDNTLVQLLNEHRWGTALNLLRERNSTKLMTKDDILEDDVSTLLHIYCKSLLSNRCDMVMITRPINYLTQNLAILMENLFKVSMALKAPHADRIHSI